MQVACGKCGTKYEFDASAIPAEGYDAQCTSCGNVFFVAPERVEELVSVRCGRCGSVYRFAPSDVPAGGYDAQCTKCGDVFFVTASGARGVSRSESVALPTPPQASVAEVSPAPAPAAAAARAAGEPVVGSSPLSQEPPAPSAEGPAETDPHSGADARGTGDADAPATAAGGEAGEGADLVALDVSLGGPDQVALDAVDDFETIHRHRRRRYRRAFGVVGVLAAAVTVLVVAFPGTFDATIGRLIGVRLTVAPNVKEALARAHAHVLVDTLAGYEKALAEVAAAQTLAPTDPDVIAVGGITHVLRALHRRTEAERLHAVAVRAAEQVVAFSQPGAPPSPADRLESLRREAKERESTARQALQASNTELGETAVLLERALVDHRGSALVALAGALYHAAYPQLVGTGEELLARSLELRLGRGVALDLRSPPDGLTAYVRALLWAHGPGERRRVREAFAAAVRTEPGLNQARLKLALELDHGGERAEAKKLLREILATHPDHTTAAELLAAWDTPPPVIKTMAVDERSKSKKRKVKRRR